MAFYLSQKKSNIKGLGLGKCGFTVKASPFNAVKLELGLILVVALAILMAVDSITENLLIQIMILAVYGLCGFGWLVWRIRTTVQLCDDHQNMPLQKSDSSKIDHV